MDMYGKPRLAELLEKLNQIDGLDWIRLMYFYPMYIDDHLLNVIAASEKIVPYIDMPLQHADNVMLRRMSRRVNQEQIEEQVTRMRELIPNLVLRTTFITGFPGETDEQFETLVKFTQRHQFERMGVFTYSFEPDTPAAKMEGHLDEEVKNARRDRLMEVQQEIMFAYNQNQIGKTIDVIIDLAVEEQPGAWIGRGFGDAPDVDSVVFVTETEHPLKPGDIVSCEVVTTHDYDLVAVAVDAPKPTASKNQNRGLPII
jgi:ribosomal protein S12 methylthiotransferase